MKGMFQELNVFREKTEWVYNGEILLHLKLPRMCHFFRILVSARVSLEEMGKFSINKSYNEKRDIPV